MKKNLDNSESELRGIICLSEDSRNIVEKNSDPLLVLDIRHLRDIIFVEDMNFQVLYASPSASELFGYSIDELKKLGKKDFMTPESLNKAMMNFQKYCALALKQRDFDIPLMEYEYIRKDGSTFWGELKVNFIRDSKGNFIGSQGILRNVDERKKIENRLRQSNYKFHTLFDLSPQAISLTKLNTGQLIDVNNKFCHLTGYSKNELIGKSTTDLGFYSDGDRSKFLKELYESGEVRFFEMNFRIKSGAFLNSQMFAKIIELENEQLILTVFYDVTKERKLERQFLQAQKMETIGTLAGGIAHDFSNVLMGIEGYVSLMMLNIENSHPHRAMLEAISEHVKSCTQLAKQLLGYARKENNHIGPINLNQLVEETCIALKGTQKHIKVSMDLMPNLMLINGDAIQIRQVLYNLYINASDAMQNGGKLSIKTVNIAHEELTSRTYKPKKGNYVSIEISDTGIGMDENTMNQLFEPFFTTKESGKGTGLGLASVYGIVKGHAGYIDVESQLGKGTKFSIHFPAVEKKENKQSFERSRH